MRDKPQDIGALIGQDIPGPPGYTYAGVVESGTGDIRRLQIYYNDEATGEAAEGVTVDELTQNAQVIVDRHQRSLEETD